MTKDAIGTRFIYVFYMIKNDQNMPECARTLQNANNPEDACLDESAKTSPDFFIHLKFGSTVACCASSGTLL